VKNWEIIADNLRDAGWSWGWVATIDSRRANDLDCGRDGKRFVVRNDEMLTAFLQLESVVYACARLS